jgi:predicted DNA binding protein
MSQIVRIEVRLPNGHWAGEVTRNHPNLVLQIIETMPLGKGRGTAQIAAEQELLSDLGTLSGIETVNLLGDDKASVTIASGGGGFIRPLRTVGVVPRTPFDVIDGWADWTIQCSSEQAKQLVNEIELENLQMKLKSTRSSEEKLLTARQREVFELAFRRGYWTAPREVTLTDLSTELGISKSTLSVMLHSIESKVIDKYYDEILS